MGSCKRAFPLNVTTTGTDLDGCRDVGLRFQRALVSRFTCALLLPGSGVTPRSLPRVL